MNLPFNEKIDHALAKAGGRLYLATLDRPALELFVRAILDDLVVELTDWREAQDQLMKDDPYWKGYTHGMDDAIVEVKTWAQEIE